MTEAEKANLFLEQVKERLVALVDNRAFVFRDTTVEDAEAYLNSRKTFEGLEEEQVSLLEYELGVEFPILFRTFLREIGSSCVFTGSDCNPKDYVRFLEYTADLILESGVNLFLTDQSVVFLVHQGYTFLYFESTAVYDTAIFQYTEGESAPQQITPSFAELVDSELCLGEDLNRNWRERGGFYVTINADGYREDHPTVASGERPLDIGDAFLKTPGR